MKTREFPTRVRIALLIAGASFVPAWVGLLVYLVNGGDAMAGPWQLMAISGGISIVAAAVLASAASMSGWRWLPGLIACVGIAAIWMGVTRSGTIGNVGGFAAVITFGGWLIVLRVLIHQLRDKRLARHFLLMLGGQLAGAGVIVSFLLIYWRQRYLRTWFGWRGDYPWQSAIVATIVALGIVWTWHLMRRVAVATSGVPALANATQLVDRDTPADGAPPASRTTTS